MVVAITAPAWSPLDRQSSPLLLSHFGLIDALSGGDGVVMEWDGVVMDQL
jgi:hypothetical protein